MSLDAWASSSHNERSTQKLYNVGIYIRLSQEDKGMRLTDRESVSVENQRIMLSGFVYHIPNWTLTRIYVDEGVSGSNFNRKGFQDMIVDARRKIINLVLVKDLSRFGRNYLEAGKYLEEELPVLGCRFVALSDGIDTEDGDNDIIPFLNAINDFYIRDVSNRIKSVIVAKAKEGHKICGATPYGYCRNPNERGKLIVDEDAAVTVKRIFALRATGMGYTAIAGVLNNDGILSPRAHYFGRQRKENQAVVGSPQGCASMWGVRSVKLILNNELYIGHTISLIRGTRSHRNSKTYFRNKSEWIRVENTHTPIIDTQTWETVQTLNQKGKEKTSTARPPQPCLFSGLLICPDCGAKMGYLSKYYCCLTYYRSGNAMCSPHRIKEKDLQDIILSHVKQAAQQISLNEGAMLDNLKTKLVTGYKKSKTDITKQNQDLEQHLYCLDNQIDRLYEDKVSGSISTETFAALVCKIEESRAEVESELESLRQTYQEAETKLADIDRWASLIKEKSTTLEVDRGLLDALIDKIEIGEKSVSDRQPGRTASSSAKTNDQPQQELRIFYKYVGLC